MRLDWDDKGDGGIGWDEWKVWHYIEETKQDFDRGDLIALITKLPNILTVPDEIGMDVDNQGRLWVVYRANDGAIWLSRSTDEYNAWEHHERLIYVPSGSRNPTIAIDDDNEYTLAMEFVPAGSEESEIWLYEPPYSGNGIKKIADGSRPLIAKNFYGDLYLFYSKDQIVYRTRKDNYFEELNLLLPYEGNKPLGFRTIIDKQSFNFWVFKHIIFVGNGVSLPNYVLTNETHLAMEQLSTKASVKSIDWVDWSFNVSFLVKDTFTQQPLEGALVTFKGRERLTNSAGIADFGRLGVLDEEDFTVNAEGYNEAGWTLEITEDTRVEVMLLGPLNLNENLSASAQVLGITWEDVRRDVTFVISSAEGFIEGAKVVFNEIEVLTNAQGEAYFPLIVAGSHSYHVSAGGFMPLEGNIEIEEDTTLEITLQPEWDGILQESLSTSAQVTGIDWEDMRYDVTFIIKDYKTGNVIENVEVDLAGRKAYTDSNGIAIFNLVTPTPTIPSYDVYLRHVDYEEDTYYNLVIGGHDTVKQVTIPLQIGLKSNPFSTKPETLSVSAGVTGILWIEV